MQMKSKNFCDEIRDKMKPSVVQYLDAIIYFRNFEKSDIHWKMIDLACSFVKGTPYEPDEDMRLHMFLHYETQKITSHLDETIGFSLDNSFRDNSKHDIETLGESLIDEICKLISTLFPNMDAVMVFKDGQIKPGPSLRHL